MTHELDALGRDTRRCFATDQVSLSSIEQRLNKRRRRRQRSKQALFVVVTASVAVLGAAGVEWVLQTSGGKDQIVAVNKDDASPISMPPVTEPAVTDQCFPEALGIRAPEFIGLSEEAGMRLANNKGYAFGVMYRDGVCFSGALPLNVDPTRLSVGIEKGTIVRASLG